MQESLVYQEKQMEDTQCGTKKINIYHKMMFTTWLNTHTHVNFKVYAHCTQLRHSTGPTMTHECALSVYAHPCVSSYWLNTPMSQTHMLAFFLTIILSRWGSNCNARGAVAAGGYFTAHPVSQAKCENIEKYSGPPTNTLEPLVLFPTFAGKSFYKVPLEAIC